MVKKEKWETRWRLTAFVLVVIVVLIITIVIKVYEPPPAAEGGIQLEIEDEHWAEWMPIDNGFTHESANYAYWNGVLIQLGSYWDRDAGGTISMFTSAESVVIFGSEGSRILQRPPVGPGQPKLPLPFKWINIVSDRQPDVPAPITFTQSRLLYPNATMTECSTIDSCAQPYPDPLGSDTFLSSEAPCLCDTLPCEEEEDLAMIPPECLRLRSIHSHFVPEAIITYWQGTNGYKLSAFREGDHNRFVFFFPDPVTIDVYQEDGSSDGVDVGEIRRIVVYGPDGIDHGEIHNPGLDGGEASPPS